MCDKLAILRSVYHNMNEHSQAVHTTLTGYAPTKGDPAQESPSCGSIIARQLGWRAGARTARRYCARIGFDRLSRLAASEEAGGRIN